MVFSLMFCLCFQKFFIKHPKVAMKMATLENLGCLFSPFWISKVGNSNDARKIVQIYNKVSVSFHKRGVQKDGVMVFSLMFCLCFQMLFLKRPKVAMKMATLENLGCLFSPFWDFQSWQQQRCAQNRPDLQQSFGEFSQKRCAKRRRDGFLFDVLSMFPKFFLKHPKVAMKMATLENLGCLFSPFWDFQSWQQQRCAREQSGNKVGKRTVKWDKTGNKVGTK